MEEIKEGSARKIDGLDQSYYSLNLMLSPDRVMRQIRHILLGEECINEADDTWKKTGEPMMDDKGVKEILKVLEMTFGIPQVLGNLAQDEYDDLIYRCDDSISDFVFFGALKHRLEHRTYNILINAIMTDFTTFLSRTKGGFQQKHITRSWGGHEVVSQKQRVETNEQKKGLFG
jgi:hypothetical protein